MNIKYLFFDFIDKARRIFKSKKINLAFHSLILNELEKKYGYIIDIHSKREKEVTKDLSITQKAWVLWWQGMDTAPDLVKKCYSSVKLNIPNVILITKDNIYDYIQLEPFVLEKFKNGKIGMAQFSDIVRVNLLYKYGGLWLDATIFLDGFDMEKDLSGSFYSLKGPDFFKAKYVPQGKWRLFFQYTSEKNPLYEFLKDFFNEYWKNENELINFFLIDYIYQLAYINNIYGFKKCVDLLPNNNEDVYKLDFMLMNDLEPNLNHTKTKVFKLNWKHKYPDYRESQFIKFLQSRIN